MISDELAQAMVDDMLKRFGSLPDPDREPKRFNAIMKLYKHIKQLENSGKVYDEK